MARRLGLWLAATTAVVVASGGRGAGRVEAGELLRNGAFDEPWTGAAPPGWIRTGGTVAVRETAAVVSGASVQLATSDGAEIGLFQRLDAAAGGRYEASVFVRGVGVPADATLSVQFLAAGNQPLASVSTETVTLTSTFQRLVATTTAPAGTASVVLRLRVLPGAPGPAAYVDEASLDETAAPATATLPPAATPTHTPTPKPAGTPPPAHTPPPGLTRSPPSPPPPATATPPPAPPFGGLLRNGNFELDEGGRPAGWSKFGGTMALTMDAYRGALAATLASDSSSLKWLHQVAPVSGGGWYVATGWMRIVAGDGEAFVRLSWYADPGASGTALAQADSPATTAYAWAFLTTGPVQAPPDATSVRVRLMLRPGGAVTAAYDDVSLAAAAAATTEPVGTPAATPSPRETAPTGPSPPGGRPTGSPTPGRTGTQGPTVVLVDGPDTLRLSEVLSDPEQPGNDGAFEWVELVNVGTAAVDTAGWQIGDGGEIDDLPAYLVSPGAFVVVAGRSATFAAGTPVIRVADGVIGAGLNNGGDLLRLLSPRGAEVDSFSWGENTSIFDPSAPAPGTGQSIGVRVAGGDAAPENWAITAAPSPGGPNAFPPRPAAAAGKTLDGDAGSAARLDGVESGGGRPSSFALVAGTIAVAVAALGAGFWPFMKGKLSRGR